MMADERFIIPNELRVIRDTLTGKEATFYESADGFQFKQWLNDLNDENEELKKQVNNFKKRLSALDDAFIDFEQKLYLEVFDIEMDEGTQEAVCEISNLLMQGLCNKDGYGKDEW